MSYLTIRRSQVEQWGLGIKLMPGGSDFGLYDSGEHRFKFKIVYVLTPVDGKHIEKIEGLSLCAIHPNCFAIFDGKEMHHGSALICEPIQNKHRIKLTRREFDEGGMGIWRYAILPGGVPIFVLAEPRNIDPAYIVSTVAPDKFGRKIDTIGSLVPSKDFPDCFDVQEFGGGALLHTNTLFCELFSKD